MNDNGLLAAADHMRDVREAEETAEAKAPLRRAHAIIRIDDMLPRISKSVHEAQLGTNTTSEFADKLEHIANLIDAVWAETTKL